MEEMQFTVMVLMSLITLTLVVLLPRQVAADKVVDRSRWLLATGTALMAVQFFLQYVYHLRNLGVTQAVMVNLLFFVPCAILFTLSIINLQQQGKVEKHIWIIGVATWLSVVVMITVAAHIDGEPLMTDTSHMRIAEYLSAIIYMLLQVYYTYILYRGNIRLVRALDNYYDHDTSSIVRWISRSTVLLAIVAVGAPFLIFSTGLPLLIYSLLIFLSLYYLVFSFISYCVSTDAQQVSEASQGDIGLTMDEEVKPITEDDSRRVESAVRRWVDSGGYLKNGITMQMAVSEMDIPRYLMSSWLKTTEWELFNPWLAHLRVEHAIRLLKEHPDWNNDTIAQQCGFTSRSYFQQIFKKHIGMTPAQYIRQNKIKSQAVE